MKAQSNWPKNHVAHDLSLPTSVARWMDAVSLNKCHAEIEHFQSDTLASPIHVHTHVLILVVDMLFMSPKFPNSA